VLLQILLVKPRRKISQHAVDAVKSSIKIVGEMTDEIRMALRPVRVGARCPINSLAGIIQNLARLCVIIESGSSAPVGE
jgi:hypothetical protein